MHLTPYSWGDYTSVITCKPAWSDLILNTSQITGSANLLGTAIFANEPHELFENLESEVCSSPQFTNSFFGMSNTVGVDFDTIQLKANIPVNPWVSRL
jgi:hypothetical protein